MGIALFSVSGLLSPIQTALTWLTEAARGNRPDAEYTPGPLPSLRLRSLVRPAPSVPIRCARPGWSRAPVNARSGGRPALRVLRVIEGQDGQAHAGRMVISGRMVDVCAELDRLARSESRVSEPLRH